jgi:hypothetical protein
MVRDNLLALLPKQFEMDSVGLFCTTQSYIPTRRLSILIASLTMMAPSAMIRRSLTHLVRADEYAPGGTLPMRHSSS